MRNVSAGYGPTEVLSDVSMELRRGSSLALIGPNGAGKSTLIKVLGASLPVRQGSVLLDSVSLAHIGSRERARRIAIVPQKLTVGFGLLARDVVMLGRTPYLGVLATPSRKDYSAMNEAMRETDTLRFAGRQFSTLSGGEAQRVILAMALTQESDFLLLDEPTVHLDLGQQWRFLNLLMGLVGSRGIGLLAILHDLNLVGRFDQAILMARGRVVTRGAPDQVVTAANVESTFGAPVNVWKDGKETRVTLIQST